MRRIADFGSSPLPFVDLRTPREAFDVREPRGSTAGTSSNEGPFLAAAQKAQRVTRYLGLAKCLRLRSRRLRLAQSLGDLFFLFFLHLLSLCLNNFA